MRSRALLAFTTILLLLSGTSTPARAEALPGWSQPGPFGVDVEIGVVHTFYAPSPLTGDHPVVIWGNGTGAIPGVYSGLLRHLATHGFIVAAANTPLSNFAITMRQGIDVLEKRDADPSSPYRGKVDLEHIGAAGHSQGGAAAINAALDSRLDTTIPVEPGPLASTSSLKIPTFYLAGQYDLVVWPPLVRAFYDASGHVPAVYGEVRNASHVTPIGDGGAFRAPVTAWFKAWLMNDATARSAFFGPCSYCPDRLFSSFRRNAKAVALP